MRGMELLAEIRKLRFEEAYEGWQARRSSQAEAALLPASLVVLKSFTFCGLSPALTRFQSSR